MKTSLLLLVACSALALSARAAGVPATFGELRVPSVAAKMKANGDEVTVDTPRIAVVLRLGSPNAVTPDGTWLYHHYVMRQGRHDAGQPATLVIRFQAGRVSQLTLADEATVSMLRDASRAPAQVPLLVAARQR